MLLMAGLQMPRLLHFGVVPPAEFGHVELSPAVHGCVQTWNSPLNRWHIPESHWELLVQLS